MMDTMTDTPVLPPNMVVRDTMQDLLGRDVQVAVADPWAPTLTEPGTVAIYVNDGYRLSALISCDLPLSAALSSSIALIPAKTAADIVKEGRLPHDMEENLYEVLNVLASLFNRQHAPHVKLYQVHYPGDVAPVDVSSRLRQYGDRSDLTMTVSGYGSGRFSIVLG